MTDRDALKLAREALLPHKSTVLRWYTKVDEALDAIDKVLAQSKQEPVAWLTDDEREAFERFNETCEDGEGYDVPKTMMRRLAEIGVIHHTSRGIYGITKFGRSLVGYTTPPQPEQEPVAWMDRDGDLYKKLPSDNWNPPHTPLYTAPQHRNPMTDEEIVPMFLSREEIIRMVREHCVPYDRFPSKYNQNIERLVQAAYVAGADAKREVNRQLIGALRYIQVQTHIGHIQDTAQAAVARATNDIKE